MRFQLKPFLYLGLFLSAGALGILVHHRLLSYIQTNRKPNEKIQAEIPLIEPTNTLTFESSSESNEKEEEVNEEEKVKEEKNLDSTAEPNDTVPLLVSVTSPKESISELKVQVDSLNVIPPLELLASPSETNLEKGSSSLSLHPSLLSDSTLAPAVAESQLSSTSSSDSLMSEPLSELPLTPNLDQSRRESDSTIKAYEYTSEMDSLSDNETSFLSVSKTPMLFPSLEVSSSSTSSASSNFIVKKDGVLNNPPSERNDIVASTEMEKSVIKESTLISPLPSLTKELTINISSSLEAPSSAKSPLLKTSSKSSNSLTTAQSVSSPTESKRNFSLNLAAPVFIPSTSPSSPIEIVRDDLSSTSSLTKKQDLELKYSRCHYWPECKFGTECVYWHPIHQCPNETTTGFTPSDCPYGSRCYFYHVHELKYLQNKRPFPLFERSQGLEPPNYFFLCKYSPTYESDEEEYISAGLDSDDSLDDSDSETMHTSDDATFDSTRTIHHSDTFRDAEEALERPEEDDDDDEDHDEEEEEELDLDDPTEEHDLLIRPELLHLDDVVDEDDLASDEEEHEDTKMFKNDKTDSVVLNTNDTESTMTSTIMASKMKSKLNSHVSNSKDTKSTSPLNINAPAFVPNFLDKVQP